MSLKERLEELTQRLNRLPEAAEPPPTTLEILGRHQQEQDWQRLLFHFLSPNVAHGLDHDFLEHFLLSLSERADLNYTFSRFNLNEVQVQTEVVTSNETRPDAVIWLPGDWFICCELKLWASETQKQTEAYLDASSFTGIGLSKDDVPPENHYYLYLAPNSASSPAADEFIHISWEWIASELQSFLRDSHGGYPARTTAQLDDFISTIRHELTMTENQENQQEKARLYFEYYDEIYEAQNAFEGQWDAFMNEWGISLAQALEVAEIIDIPDLPDSQVAIELPQSSGGPERWIFRQGNSWAGIAKEQWRRRTDDHSVIYSSADVDNYAHITLYHRLEKNRQQAIRDNVLELTLWHGNTSDKEFWRMVNDRVAEKLTEINHNIPPAVELTGRNGSILTANYHIPVEKHDDFFDAYTAALRNAFLDLVVDNHGLVTVIDEAFQESLEVYY